MGGAVRIILIVLVLVLVAAGAGYFLVPPVASRSETLTVEAPPATVLARLSSTPVGATVVEGVTVAEAASVEGDTVTAPVTYADGATGRVVYSVSPEGEGSRVQVKLEQNLGANPLDRFAVLTGGEVAPLIGPAAAAATADLGALPSASFEGLQYNVVQLEARPFFYVENCSSTEPDSITSILNQAAEAIPALMRANRLTAAGPLMAVEPRVVEGRYCYNIGYPFTGRAPTGDLLTGAVGATPAGQALRVVYTGTEADVLAQVYDPMDALLAAAHLDNPGTREDDWTTYEVYNDDPTQAGGSRNREIYYVAQGDISALTRIAPPTEPAAVPANAPAADPAAAPATTPAPAGTPAPTPAPATP